MRTLCLDVGGTKVAGALYDGKLDEPVRRPTGADPWETVTAVLDPLAAQGIDQLGVACGGPMQWPAGVVAPLNIAAWAGGFPLRDRLAERYAVPVRVHNDAVCVAAAEHWQGGWGVQDLLGMVVSTGVGGGLVLGGRLVDGGTGNAGHLGHVVVDPMGPACSCGGRGCLEAVARGPALVAWARSRGSKAADGADLARLAGQGNSLALQAFARAGRALGVGIASAVALLDVRVVAVGGGISQAPSLWPTLRRTLAEHSKLAFARDVLVEPARLGQDAGLVGAAALFEEQYWTAGD